MRPNLRLSAGMRRNIDMPTVWWLLFVVMLVGLVLLPLVLAWRVEAEQPARESPLAAPGVQGATRIDFMPMKAEVENLYTQQSLNAQYVLGWNRGVQWDSYVDWEMGKEFTYRPWEHSGWRDYWGWTPGQRFAFWWTEYCVINCDHCVGSGCDEVREQLAAQFDVALSGVTER